jgi:hypothetical protein
MRKCDNAVVGKKLARYKSSVRGCNVIMEQPIARKSQFRSFHQISTLRTAKNIAVELGVHGLAFRGKFMVRNPSNVKKHDEELVSKYFDTPTYVQPPSLQNFFKPLICA